MAFSSNVLTLEINDHIATLWLDRSDKRNAMAAEFIADLPRAMAAIAYTGKDINAARADKIGLVNDVYADADAVYTAAVERAAEIAANAPLAVRGTKFILQQGEDLTTEQGLLLNGLWTMVTTLNSNDLNEAMQAFMEKRPRNFRDPDWEARHDAQFSGAGYAAGPEPVEFGLNP